MQCKILCIFVRNVISSGLVNAAFSGAYIIILTSASVF